jgi:B9 domain-containing protein 2
MLNAFATPQIYIAGRIINAVGFDSNELYLKYKIITGVNYKTINGVTEGETFQSLSLVENNLNVVYFDQPLYLNLSLQSIKGWPKILLEIWANDKDGRNCLAGYGTAFLPCSPGYRKISVNCWRPTEEATTSLREDLLSNNAEFLDKSAVYSTVEKFGIYSISTGQVNIEVEMIFKDFNLHGIEI